MIVSGSMWILNFVISMINFMLFTKKKLIKNTINLINYTGNVVKNSIMDLPLKKMLIK